MFSFYTAVNTRKLKLTIKTLERHHFRTTPLQNDTILEAAAQACSVKKVFLEISQNSQENTCAGLQFY